MKQAISRRICKNFSSDHGQVQSPSKKASITTDVTDVDVDDNDTTRTILSNYLNSLHLKVTTAENGEKAINVLKQSSENYGLIFLKATYSE